MKNLNNFVTVLFLLLAVIFVPVASAQTPMVTNDVTPTTSEKLNEKLNTQINQLKDKIASRVSELNLVEKRGLLGTISETSTNKITLTDMKGNTKQVDIDEITKFSSSTAKGTFGLSDLTKGTKVTVLGLYNKQSKRTLARFIRTSVDPVFVTGGISELDSRNFTFSVLSEDQKTTKIDHQPSTKIANFSSDGTPTRLTFARLATGDRVAVIGYPDKTDPELIVASRISVFPELPKNPKINVSIQQPTPTLVPTTVIRRTTIQAPIVTSIPTPSVSR